MPSASNFDHTLETVHNDASCQYVIVGCMDSLAANYNPSATAEATPSICNIAVVGCTDEDAFNYDSAATVLDDSCVTIQPGCRDSVSGAYVAGANVNAGGRGPGRRAVWRGP